MNKKLRYVGLLVVIAVFTISLTTSFVGDTEASHQFREDITSEPTEPSKTVLVAAPIQTGCEPGTVKTGIKIIFGVVTQLDAAMSTADPEILFPGQAYAIKVPDTVGVIADLHQIVLDVLLEEGYTSSVVPPRPGDIIILDVEYTTFCIQP